MAFFPILVNYEKKIAYKLKNIARLVFFLSKIANLVNFYENLPIWYFMTNFGQNIALLVISVRISWLLVLFVFHKLPNWQFCGKSCQNYNSYEKGQCCSVVS